VKENNMSRKKAAIQSMIDAVGAKYDSDEDLTAEDRKKIKESLRPDKTRDKLWEKKGVWDKTKKLLKSKWYGDKQAKNK
jgi:hypothetical protein